VRVGMALLVGLENQYSTMVETLEYLLACKLLIVYSESAILLIYLNKPMNAQRLVIRNTSGLKHVRFAPNEQLNTRKDHI